jgi:hypothetical protein
LAGVSHDSVTTVTRARNLHLFAAILFAIAGRAAFGEPAKSTTQPKTLPTAIDGAAASLCRRDLSIPPMELAKPAPGKRVRLTLPDYEKTEIFYSLYLPTDWRPDKQFPVIVEYQGNGGAIALPGLYDSCLGYGQSGGKGFIWVCLPYISPEKTQQLIWWGDIPATLDFCRRVVRTVCESYGGDGSAVLLTGFSRGAIACNYLGLHDDATADLWLAFLPHSHYEGKWPGSKKEDHEAMLARLARLRGRASFVTNEGPEIFPYARAVIEKSDAPFTLVPLPDVRHTNSWVLEDCPQRKQLREWLTDILQKRPGTQDVSGRVTDENETGIEGVRIEGGFTRWTFTDADGRYTLRSLIVGPRTLTASKSGVTFANAQITLTLAKQNVTGQDFHARPGQ